MNQKRLRQLEEQCIQECAPPCTSLCPVHVDIRSVAEYITKEDFPSALQKVGASVLFPEIIARTCDQPCQLKCNRHQLGGAIQVADLEQACVKFGGEYRPKLLPPPFKQTRVAVIGGGLSGMSAAFELSKKGYRVDLFEAQSRLGGRLWELPRKQMPEDVIFRETRLPEKAGCTVILDRLMDETALASGEYDATFLGTGEISAVRFPGISSVDPITFQTNTPNIFAAGSLLHPHSTILSVSDGRRAAISIDRFLQKVSLTASRGNEGSYESCLLTNLENYSPSDLVSTAIPESGYTEREAISEATRCFLCECMECVKVCEYLKQYGSYPKKYVREIYNNLTIIMRARTSNKFINSCTLCGLCGEVCPTDLSMAEVVKETRRTMVKTGKMPPSAHDFALRDMEFSNSARAAATLTLNGAKTCGYLYFPGCQLAASEPDYVQKSYQTLRQVYPDLGIMLGCCGAPADWSGEEKIFNQTLESFSRKWESLGKPVIILACASCHKVIRKALPGASTISIWEVFNQNGLYPDRADIHEEFVIHDPCSSRYEDAWQEAARVGLRKMAVPFHELELSREKTACCGYGGVAWLANPELTRKIITRRIQEDDASYLTYCAMCRDLFATAGKKTLHMLDLVFGNDLRSLANRRGPDYSQRHENRIRTRQKMEKLILRKESQSMETHEMIKVCISPGLSESLETRLILVEDIQRVIEHVETSGEFFLHPKTGHKLGYFKPNFITYWVEFRKDGDTFEVFNAYSHRMEFEGNQK